MAISSNAPMHFDAGRFDALADRHGTPALWRKARLCPCIDPTTGHPKLNCPTCEDGIIWDAGTAIKVLAFSRQRDDVYNEAGQRMEGMVTITFPSSSTPGHLDLVELTAAETLINNEVHVRAAVDKLGRSTERLRLRQATFVEACEALIGTPPVLTAYAFFTDFTVNAAGDIVWNPGAGPADGVQYTMRYRARPAFVVWAPQSRDENAARMPYRARAQRFDFFRRLAVGETP